MQGMMEMEPDAGGTMARDLFQTLVDLYLDDMLRRGRTEDSILTNQRTLNRFTRAMAARMDCRVQQLALHQIQPQDLERYLETLHERKARWRAHPKRKSESGGLSPFTIRKEIRILKGFGNWLSREGSNNPFSSLVVPEVPERKVRILSDEEIGTILRSIDADTPYGSRLYAMVLLLLDSGLCLSELAKARLPDLNFELRQLRIEGKDGNARIVPFGIRTTLALLEYIDRHRPAPDDIEVDRLFLSLEGNPLNRVSLTSIIYRLRTRSGIRRLNAQLCRNTFAVRFLENGGDLSVLQQILGYESLEYTRRYLRLVEDQAPSPYDPFTPVDRMTLADKRRFGNKKRQSIP
jgi:site-specific recombinase XerD